MLPGAEGEPSVDLDGDGPGRQGVTGVRAVNDEPAGGHGGQLELGGTDPLVRTDALERGLLNRQSGGGEFARDRLAVRRGAEQDIRTPADGLGGVFVLDLEQ